MRYKVTIEATVRKTYTIDADTEEEAAATAQDMFVVAEEDGIPERYQQDIVEIERD